MDRFTADQFAELLEVSSWPTLSIYLPMGRSPIKHTDGLLRLRNLLDQAEHRLRFSGLSLDEAASLLAQGRRLQNDQEFWSQPGDGLAIFAAPGFNRAYRLPLSFDEQLKLGRAFSLRPLLPLLDNEDSFFIIALSEKELRLLRCGRDRVELAGLPEAPPSLEANEQYGQRERYLGFYSRGPGSGARFYGQNSASDREELAQEDFALRVARALDEELAGESAPLLIAATNELGHMLRHRLRYPATLDILLSGNPDQLSAEQLRLRAWPLISPRLELPRREALERLRSQLGNGRGESQGLPLVQAALEGRVETLFVSPDGLLAGHIDPQSGLPQAAPEGGQKLADGEEDLLELSVSSTLRGRGRVYLASAAELPDQAPAAALLRY